MKRQERLYLQYEPDKESLKQLLKLQTYALENNPQSRPLSSERLHLTLLHFGILSEVYDEIYRINTNLSWQHYSEAVKTFVKNSDRFMPEVARAKFLGFGLLGPNKNVLAARFEVDDAVSEAHVQALRALKVCLNQCGVENPEHFMLRSPNFRYAAVLNPHITLLRQARNMVLFETPTTELGLCKLPPMYSL
jgi:hypothetical protein